MDEVIFGVKNQRIAVKHDRASLHLGAIVHVTFDEDGSPTAFSQEPQDTSVPHCVTWIAPSEWYVPLDVVELDERFRKRVRDAMEGYLVSSEVDRGLDRAISHVRLEESFKTEEFLRGPLGVISGVLERLDFIRRLDDDTVRNRVFWHWEPLSVYLALTCFDLLGQPSSGWRSMREWLKEAQVSGLPQELAARVRQTTDPVEACVLLADTYQSIYGVRRSFYRFIREVLPDLARRDLLESITLHDTSLPPSMHELPTPGDEEKERYLFETRNNYTHRARFVGGAGIAPPTELARKEDVWRMREQTINAKRMRSASCRDWPDVLVRSAHVGLASFILSVPTRDEI